MSHDLSIGEAEAAEPGAEARTAAEPIELLGRAEAGDPFPAEAMLDWLRARAGTPSRPGILA